MKFDSIKIRENFPILHKQVYGKPLAYLDNAATTQKPQQVIDAIRQYYRYENSNVHRGVHYLSQQATDKYEEARKKVQQYINASKSSEIVFTRGTTESINLIANTFGRKYVKKGDEIIISEMEHHSNIVPWQMMCEERGAKLRVIPIANSGEIMVSQYKKMFTNKTKLVAITHISNSLGTINPIKDMITTAHANRVPVLIDGAQAIVHSKVDVQELNCDFYCFSGHKFYGPTGIGILYGKEYYLDELPPYQGGGEMIEKVSFEKTTYNELPYKFEAGTPNIAGAIGLKVALDFIEDIGIDQIAKYEDQLLQYATSRLQEIEKVKIFGTAHEKAAVISFLVGNIHPFDTGTLLDKMGIAVRTGHHCTQPIMDKFKIPGTVRASLAMYNTIDEIDRLVDGIKRVKTMFE